MDNPQHPDPAQELPPPPEEKLLTVHAGNENTGGNPVGNAPTSKSNKWQRITWAIIAVIILEVVSIYFLKTENDIKILQSIFGITPTSAPTAVPTHEPQPSPTSLPTPTQAQLSCKPRPACLDAEPRCMIPETDDMCPKTEPTNNPQ